MVEGQKLPELVRGPITRDTLSIFAVASHDHLPLHIDSDYARLAGMDDVIAHGMLSMAYLGQGLRIWVPQDRIREWRVRFTAITPIHALVHCRGEVADIFDNNGERRARLRIGTWTHHNVQTIKGEAIVTLD